MTGAQAADRDRQVLAHFGLVRYRLRAAGRPDAGSEAGLAVSALGSRGAPEGQPASAIWAAVLAWLDLGPDQVHWRTDGGVVLPAVADWSAPEGKRGLWLALKGRRRRAG